MLKASGDYDAGWGKPPQHSRFKKGHSGNPNGRPPKARSLKTDLAVFLPAWMLGRVPRLHLIIVSQQMDLATHFSRLIRQIIAKRFRASVSDFDEGDTIAK